MSHNDPVYRPIWEAIKRRDKCEVACGPQDWQRIKRAIRKKKYEDEAFKIMNSDDQFRLYAVYDEKREVLVFKLVAKIGVMDKVLV